MASCWRLAGLLSITSLAVQAEAAEPLFTIDIPAGPIDRGLATLASQTGISVGTGVPLPNRRVRAVRGRMSAEEALRRLLHNSGLEARRLGNGVWQLVPARGAAAPGVVAAPSAPRQGSPGSPPIVPEIVVTGLRRPQPLFSVAGGLAVVSADDLRGAPPISGSFEVASRVEGLTLTNLGRGQNRQFIRGVADSPFNGYSQSTVSIAVDDARITYDAPDPDLRLVDMERVEVLKGPQGPLYGTGALGGVYRLVTRRPDPDRSSVETEAFGTAFAPGGAGGGASLVINAPLQKGRLAIRGSFYGAEEPGWIDNIGGHHNANQGHVTGGRLALRWLPATGWTADLTALGQFLKVDDSQYVSGEDDSYRRVSAIPEPHSNDMRLLAATVAGPIGTLLFSSTTSWIQHEVSSRLDASASAPLFGLPAPLSFQDHREYTLLGQEMRLSGGLEPDLSWLTGASFLLARSDVTGTAGSTPRVSLSRTVIEIAAYGEATIPLPGGFRLQPGVRFFTASTEDELTERASAASRERDTRLGINPSLSIAWQQQPDRLVYARYARATRPAGLAPGPDHDVTRFDSDHLDSLELGVRLRSGSTLSAEGAVYGARWSDLQSDYLLADGLVSTRNAGDASVLGAEATVTFRPASGWRAELGGTLQHARLEHSEVEGFAADDRRLPIVPDFAVRASLGRSFSWAGWDAEPVAGLHVTGPSRLSFDPELDRTTGTHVRADAGVAFEKMGWRLALQADNLFGSREDTFAFGNPFSLRTAPQFTPQAPTELTFTVSRHWP